ncbi:hypothetical protein [Kribbella sp. CA-293567]|uniref:hypothetical protein n=1 Tax=Kribbella sp. CA-293567 TaxID=3002436 RepID=UPI0022DE6CA0|nr:hypothetical protein [Kribbella sp. CA-293567]WBQ03075.1 hypothetical protein OX958_24205 [Kribbella sp. CA-293567]
MPGPTLRGLLTPSRTKFGVAVFGLSALLVFLVAGCSDSAPDASNPPASSPTTGSTGSTPSAPGSTAPIPTASTPSLTPLPTPSKPWPTPSVKGEPASDAPLAQRIRFAISKQTQVTAGRAATTTVNCPGIDKAETAGKHTLDCTVTYAGKSYQGTLTVDAKQYSASYKFTSDEVAIVRPKVVDAVLRTVPDAAKVTCTMDDVAIVKPAGEALSCDVTTTANAVQPYRARISGNGQVLVAKA